MFQIFLPDIGFLFQLIGQYQQVPVNQSIAVGWNARHSPQEFGLLAELFNTDHVLNISYLSAPSLGWLARRREATSVCDVLMTVIYIEINTRELQAVTPKN